MLHVIRTATVPAILESSRAHEGLHEMRWAAEHQGRAEPPRKALWAEKAVRVALDDVFARKCAYCENPIIESPMGVVDHHRPKNSAINGDGTISSRHYWWLVYEWTNLFLSCVSCNRYKAKRFPVIGARAEIHSDLAEEEPMLLNPCDDDPDAHLTFLSDGLVVSDTDRGRTTIEILALNREALITARRERANTLFETMKAVGNDSDLLRRMLDADQPYAAMCRQLLNARTVSSAHKTAVQRQRRLNEFAKSQKVRLHYDLAPDSNAMGETAKQRYFGSTKWIERIVLTNFRAIRSLTLDFSRSASDGGPWTVLLGENGTGKSSVLQALALTLMGDEKRRQLVSDAGGTVRRRARRGTVEVYLSGNTQPLVLQFHKGAKDFDGPAEERVVLLGYGSTRLPSRGTTSPKAARTSPVRVDNLFDPLLPVTDPEEWLLSLDGELFDRVGKWLEQLLAFTRGQHLVRHQASGTVELRAGGSRSSLKELSDGYQSMLILACDIMRTLLPLWENNLEQAEGIVIIDELGAHLHPRWRMRIVAALRGVLPRVQFIATTHDPLCLRGLENGEVTVLRRDEQQNIFAISDLPPVKGLRVEQLLASDFFGLGSTRDPEIDDLYEEYYLLRGRRSLSQRAGARLARIEEELMEADQLGTTEQERLVFRAAGDYIARRRASADVHRDAQLLDDDVRRQLSELWSARLPTPDSET